MECIAIRLLRNAGSNYKDFYYYGCKHRNMTRGHKCDYRKQVHEELLDDAVAEVISKLVSNPKFSNLIRSKINMEVDTGALDQEIANYEKQLRQLYHNKDSILSDIDSLDYEDKHYVFEQVEKNIDNLVVNQADWTASASKEELDAAREGKLTLHFFDKIVPKEWLKDIKGKKVLCLAGAGGLQAPLLACAGAKVTVIDISNKMLDKDREIAKREKLSIEIVKGNMCDLSMFEDGYFDMIINPPSLMYIPDLSVVFKECYRVMVVGGTFIAMAPNPINYVCDWIDDDKGGYYKAVHKMPWCSRDFDESEWIEYGHTMEEYLGGLISCGFVINGYVECQREDITELMFMTRAVK